MQNFQGEKDKIALVKSQLKDIGQYFLKNVISFKYHKLELEYPLLNDWRYLEDLQPDHVIEIKLNTKEKFGVFICFAISIEYLFKKIPQNKFSFEVFKDKRIASICRICVSKYVFLGEFNLEKELKYLAFVGEKKQYIKSWLNKKFNYLE